MWTVRTSGTWSESTTAPCPGGRWWSGFAMVPRSGPRCTSTAHGVIEAVLPRRRPRCPRTGPCRTRRTTATCCGTPCPAAMADAGVDPVAGHRHRHRLHRLHRAADARRRHPAVRDARAARPAARLGEAVEAPRRPVARRPDQRAGPRAGRAVDRPVRRQDLRRVAVRQGSADPRGGSGGLPPCRALRSRPPTGSSGSCAATETRNVCTAGYKGIRQDGQVPVDGLPDRAQPWLRRLRGQAGRSAAAAGRAGPARSPPGPPPGPGCRRASRSRSATSTRTSPRPPPRR